MENYKKIMDTVSNTYYLYDTKNNEIVLYTRCIKEFNEGMKLFISLHGGE